jgi:hypothetical protein
LEGVNVEAEKELTNSVEPGCHAGWGGHDEIVLREERSHKILGILIDTKDVTRADIGASLDPPVTRQTVSYTALGMTHKARVQKRITEVLGIPEDFFQGGYELTMTLKKKSEAA